MEESILRKRIKENLQITVMVKLLRNVLIKVNILLTQLLEKELHLLIMQDIGLRKVRMD